MTPEQINVVQRTFAHIRPHAETAATLFYTRLFTLDPSLRLLFTGNMPQQGAMLMLMLALAVDSLHDPATLIATRFNNLAMIPADLDLAGAEVEVARLDDHLTRLRDVLGSLGADTAFDYIFLDCPPSLGILMTNGLVAAHQLLIPLQCEYLALEGLSKIVQLGEQIHNVNVKLSIGGIVMTMYDARTNLSQQVMLSCAT